MAGRLRPWIELRLHSDESIIVATSNHAKLRELIALWGEAKPQLVAAPEDYQPVEEPFDAYEQNAVAKARALSDLTHAPVLADDSGLEVEALGWGPGVRSARTPSASAGCHERNADILNRLSATNDLHRRARFVCVCALVVPGFEALSARGESEGTIALAARGSAGFGYDPIFIYPAYGVTFAQAGEDMKHAVSHRGHALRALRARMASLIRRASESHEAKG
ncbi:MAG: non-canonical purine NTP pyrophosphatase [Candidatus Eremiobacteraeota bacterium]|nr:non-canonical purine NTP pyrophosphatase [Candidatus Eremiobacteraeota bacterium]